LMMIEGNQSQPTGSSVENTTKKYSQQTLDMESIYSQ
jgi:hypothetical protein